MKTYQLEKLGGPGGIVLHEREAPTPGPHDIVVRVRAASINKRRVYPERHLSIAGETGRRPHQRRRR